MTTPDEQTVERVAKAINGPHDATYIGAEKLRELQDYRWNHKTHKSEKASALNQARAALSAMPDTKALDWAVEKWRDEVQNRPLQNVHRRTLDDTWRTVMRKFGGDPDILVGPSHDDLLTAREPKA